MVKFLSLVLRQGGFLILVDIGRRVPGRMFPFLKHISSGSVFKTSMEMRTQPPEADKGQRGLSPMSSWALVITYLRLLLREFHIIKNPEHNSEQVLPPVLFKGVAVALHDLKHDRESSAGTKPGAEGRGGGREEQSREWESMGQMSR